MMEKIERLSAACRIWGLLTLLGLLVEPTLAQEFVPWETENAQEESEMREYVERGAIVAAMRKSDIGFMLPGLKLGSAGGPPERNASPEFAKKVLNDFRTIIAPHYLPKSLAPYFRDVVEQTVPFADGFTAPYAIVGYKLISGGKEYFIRLMWRENFMEGFLTCEMENVSVASIEKSADKVLKIPLKRARVRKSYLGESTEAHDNVFKVYGHADKRRKDLTFPRTIQIDHPDLPLVVRGGVCPLRLEKDGAVQDYKAIAFRMFLNQEAWVKPPSSAYVE